MATLVLERTAFADAMITDTGPDDNYAAGQEAYVGDASSSANCDYRTLFKFSFPDWLKGAKVTAVRLKLWDFNSYNGGGGPNSMTITLRRCKRPWTASGVTWNKYDGTNAWQTAGGKGANDIEGSDSLSVSHTVSSPALAYDTFGSTAQMVADVRGWIDGTIVNYGWLMYCDQGNIGVTQYCYGGWYRSLQKDPGSAPMLEIDYYFPRADVMWKRTSGLLYADRFDRADSSTMGKSWLEENGGGGGSEIVSNAYKLSNTNSGTENYLTCTGFSPCADHMATMKFATYDKANQQFTNYIIVRRVSASTYYFCYFQANNDSNNFSVYLFKKVSGDFTNLGGGNYDISDGDILALSVVGTALKLYKNGSLLLEATDSAISSNGYTGYKAQCNGPSQLSGWMKWDDFITQSGTSIKVFGLSSTQAFRLYDSAGNVLGGSGAQSNGAASLDLRTCTYYGQGAYIKIFRSTDWTAPLGRYPSDGSDLAWGSIVGGDEYVFNAWGAFLSDDFEDNDLAGWTNGGSWATASGGLNGSSYRAKAAAGASSTLSRTFTGRSRVRLAFRTKPLNTTADHTHGYFDLYSGNTRVAHLLFLAGNISLNGNNVATYTADTEYLVEIECDCNTDKSCITINGTRYDNSGPGWANENAVDTVDKVLFDCYSATGTDEIKLDDVYLDEPAWLFETVIAQAGSESVQSWVWSSEENPEVNVIVEATIAEAGAQAMTMAVDTPLPVLSRVFPAMIRIYPRVYAQAPR